MKRFLPQSVLLCLIMQCPLFSRAQKDFIPLAPLVWQQKLLSESSKQQWFMFDVSRNQEFLITLVNQSKASIHFQLFDNENSNEISESILKAVETFRLQRIAEQSTRLFLLGESNSSIPALFSLKYESIDNMVTNAIDLMGLDNTRKAFNNFNDQVAAQPDDPRLNLYVSALRLIDMVETPVGLRPPSVATMVEAIC